MSPHLFPVLSIPVAKLDFMLLDTWIIWWNFNWLWRFSPRLNSKKKKLLVEFELVKTTRTYIPTKARYWHNSLFFLPLKLEPNVPLRGVEERERLSCEETGLTARRNGGQVETILRVCLKGCACGCVFEQIVRTFLWDKARSVRSVWKCMLGQKNEYRSCF